MLAQRMEDLRNARFIPTRVGNAPRARWPSAQVAVHPHASGECVNQVVISGFRSGSSPREWGMQNRE